MKLHLPSALRKALLAVFSVMATQPVMAAIYSEAIGQTIYADFADNCGLYSTRNVNSMLEEVRRQEGGIYIYYNPVDNEKYELPEKYKLPEEMISYDSLIDGGYAAGISYNFTATVRHNGVLDPTFSATKVDSDNAIRYSGIEYRSSEGNIFLLTPNFDYKITRLSKVVTDVTMSEPNTGTFGQGNGQMLYRAGSGSMVAMGDNGEQKWMSGAYNFNIGGMMTVSGAGAYSYGKDVRGIKDDSGYLSVTVGNKWKVSDDPSVPSPINLPRDPMPFGAQGGDSGSPTWLWNAATQSYVYAGAVVGGNVFDLTYVYYAPQWTVGTIDYFDSNVKMDTHDITINAVGTAPIETKTSNVGNNVIATGKLYEGKVVDTNTGAELASFIGVQSGKNTWLNLDEVRDQLNWYAYAGEGDKNNKGYLNATNDLDVQSSTANPKDMSYGDLFYTQNLVFEAKDGDRYDIRLSDTVDTGLGYAHFSKVADVDKALFYVTALKEGSQLNTAGFVVDAGVELHMELTGQSDYLREWRKVGEGDLFIEGNGNNDILLNLGGSGTTYLQRNDGYAAYNVLANNGTRVVISGVNQIKRDFTFGNGGAILDMNGQSMAVLSADEAKTNSTGFSIHALTQEAIITNSSDTGITLTWQDTEWVDNQATYMGSFQDVAGKGSLRINFAAADDKKLILNSIYTKLTNDNSGITVTSGTLALEGNLTVHAPGSAAIPGSRARLENPDDWHYAEMTSPVTVTGGTFELGSHALLKGDVTVSNNGTFLVRESVTHQMEYIEGSYTKYNTDDFSDFFGHKGDVVLDGQDATMKIEFNKGVDSTLVYGNSISGDGQLHVNSGADGGIIQLAGNNTDFTGKKYVDGGGLVITESQAVGNTSQNKWIVGEQGWISVDIEGVTSQNALGLIDSSSDGVLALHEPHEDLLDTSGHQNLFIGTAPGKTVEYGTDSDTLNTNSKGQWLLGGGGGELVVKAQLNNENGELVLGNEYTIGTVTLDNANNKLKTITFGGQVTLNYTSLDALGESAITLEYGRRITGLTGVEGHLTNDSEGVILMDKMGSADNVNLSTIPSVSLGADSTTTFNGQINIGNSDTYHLGGGKGALILGRKLENGSDGAARNIMVDGQAYSGGIIELAAAAEITGTVTVQGCNNTKEGYQDASGSVTLRLMAENALANAERVTVKDGGIVDICGKEQQLNNVVLESGGSIVDSSDDRSGTFKLAITADTTWYGVVDTGSVEVTTGGKKLTLNGSAYYDKMYVKNGSTVVLGGNETLSATGTTYIESGATLNAEGKKTSGAVVVQGRLNASKATFSGRVELRGGHIDISDGGFNSDSTLYSYGGTLSGLRISLASDTHLIEGTTIFDAQLYGSDVHAKISGNVSIAEGAILQLKYGEQIVIPIPPYTYSYLEYDINSSEFNMGESGGGGTLFVDTNRLYLRGTNQAFGGIVKVGSHSTVIQGDNGDKTFENLELTSGTTTLKGNANWSIANMKGSGNLTSNTNQTISFTGESEWSGTITKTSSGILSISGEKALQNATVALSDTAKLAVDNESVSVYTLTGGAGNVIQAGESIRAGEAGTLEIRHGGSFGGSVVARGVGMDEAGEPTGYSYVSLVMNGSGSNFTLKDGQMTFKDVTVQSGMLVFSTPTENIQILNGVTLARGGSLVVNDGLNLQTGHFLHIVGAGEAAVGSANLSGGLTLDGGTLSFSGSSLRLDGAAALHVNGSIAYGAASEEKLVVDFTDTSDIILNREYVLSDSDWNSVGSSGISSNLDYLKATFIADQSGLKVTFGLQDDCQVWNGTDTKHDWTTSVFGNNPAVGPDQTAVFTNTASFKTVNITEDIQVQGLIFNSTEEYSLAGSTGHLSANTMEQTAAGTTTLGNGVTITGTADVKAGSLVLQEGSRVNSIEMAEGTSLQVNHDACGIESISGKGAVEMNMAAEQTFDLNKLHGSSSLMLDGQGCYESSSGAVHTDSLTVKKDATLSLTGADIYTGGGSVVLGGSLEMEIGTESVLSQNIKADTEVVHEEGKEEKIIEIRGDVTKSGIGFLTVAANVTADTMTVNGGSVTVAQEAEFDVNTLTVTSGTFTMLKDGAATKMIGSMTLGENAVFALNNVTETSSALALDSLKLTGGSATLEQQKNVGGIKIASLQQDAGATSTLTLANGTSSNKVALFELGAEGRTASNFNGDIRVVNSSNSTNRSTALVINNGEMTKDARIDMSSVAQTNVKVALGLNDTTVKIAGLSSSSNLDAGRSLVFGGALSLNENTTASVFDGDGVARSLEITTRGDNVFYGAVGKDISITVGGIGTQAFMGNSEHFNGALTVGDSATMVIGSAGIGMLNQTSELTVNENATLQTEAAATLNGSANLSGTLALGGAITTQAELTLGSNMNIILGGSTYTSEGNIRTYDVFIQQGEGRVTGWENLKEVNFGGFGTLERGAVITKLNEHDGRYQVTVDMSNLKRTAITWSDDVAVGTWDSDNANFSENGARTAYYDGDTVTIASDATIAMGQAVNLQNTEQQTGAGTLNVADGAHATVTQTTDKTLKMDTLHVKDNSEFTINSVAGNFADNTIVDEGSTLNVRFGATLADSGAVKEVTGGGTLHLVNTNGSGLYDLGDNALSGETKQINLSGFTGTLELGNGSTQIRLRDDRVGVLNSDATIVVNAGAQFWKTKNGGNNTTLNNDIVLRGNSGATGGNSKDGFGAVRGATGFTGEVTIDGNAMVSGATNITFNGNIKGSGDNDTLTFGCYYGGQGNQTYTLSAGMQTEGLANMVVRQSGNNGTTTVNVDSAEGLAEKLAFADGVGNTKAVVNVNASNSIQRLESTAGNGVVNIAEGKSLEITGGAVFGGQIRLAQAATVTSSVSDGVVQQTGGATFESTAATAVSITGAEGTSLENACINLTDGSSLKINKVTMAGQAAITGANGSRIDTSLIDLAAGTRLEMANVTFGVNSSAGGEATLVANELTVEAQLKPLTYGDAAPTPVEEPVEVASLTLTNIQDVIIEGAGEDKGLLVHLVGMSNLGNAQWLQVDLGGDGQFADNLAVTLQYEDASGQHSVRGQYTMEDVEVQAAAEAAALNHDYVYFRLTGTVPEPATSTLSLLALAALAARRRRK